MKVGGIEAPFYRLISYGDLFLVEVVLGETRMGILPEGDDRDLCVDSRELGMTTTREAAMAVLRLHGATEFQDWTLPTSSWSTPMCGLEIAA